MQDLHLHGRCFTWSNERENPTLVRLDRVLVSIDWDEMFPSSHLRTLESMHPITARFSYIPTWGACPRRDSILKFSGPRFEDYGQIVLEAWRGPVSSRGPLARLNEMLRALIRALQSWSAAKIGGIKEHLLMARELVHRLDMAQDTRQLSEPEAALRKRMKLRCLGLASLERTIARQQSRIRHLTEGTPTRRTSI